MKKKVTSSTPNAQFNRNSKFVAYTLIAILLGTALVLEDISEGDASPSSPLILAEFIGIALVFSLAFPVYGTLYRWSKNKFCSLWKWNRCHEIFAVCWVVVLPVVLMLLVSLAPIGIDGEVAWLFWVSFLILSIAVMAIEMFWDMLERRQQLETANEKLLRSHDLAKYQALMNQLNPHFLFNSLNVLSFLIYRDPRNAEKFVEELSKIYRYVIELNETYIVPLKKELEFIDSYFFLQSIRFKDNLKFESAIEAEALELYVPPLTLEVLFENAVKHNAISKQHPLCIKMFNENGYLVVENNIQSRNENEVESTKVGLRNLLEKFMLLEKELPEFSVENGFFVARIPLLKY